MNSLSGTEISLTCHSSHAPGTTLSASIRFVPQENGFIVLATGKDSGDLLSQVVSIGAEPLNWRTACAWLLDADALALWGDFRAEVEVVGGQDASDILGMAWLREWEFQSEAEWLVSLKDETIAALRKDMGDLSENAALLLIREYLALTDEDPLQTWSVIKAETSRRFSLSELNVLIAKRLDINARIETDTRTGQLARWREAIDQQCSSAGDLFPRVVSGWAANQAQNRVVKSIRHAIENFVILNSRLPTETEYAAILAKAKSGSGARSAPNAQ